MKSLFIDTSTANLIVAITKDNELLSLHNELTNLDMSVKIFPIIEDIFKKNKMVAQDISTIFVVNGPGSFTGIRVGLTIAKVYSWSLEKKIIPVSSLELISSTSHDSDYAVSLIDARRGYVYAGMYDKELNCIIEDKHVLLEDFYNALPKDKKITFISYDEFDLPDLIKPEIDILKVINKHYEDKGSNPHNLNPNYLKLTEAEENLKND